MGGGSSSLCDVLTPQIIPDKVQNIVPCLIEVVRTFFNQFFPKRAAKPRSGRSPTLG